jgi:hypothetical protein
VRDLRRVAILAVFLGERGKMGWDVDVDVDVNVDVDVDVSTEEMNQPLIDCWCCWMSV